MTVHAAENEVLVVSSRILIVVISTTSTIAFFVLISQILRLERPEFHLFFFLIKLPSLLPLRVAPPIHSFLVLYYAVVY